MNVILNKKIQNTNENASRYVLAGIMGGYASHKILRKQDLVILGIQNQF